MAAANGEPTPKKVWATLITSTSYLPGLLVLNHSLRRTNTKYPLIALYTDAFPPSGLEALARRHIRTRRVEALLPTVEKSYGDDPRFADTWSKLAIFECVEYDRVVLLDSDMLVRQNMDELMDLPLDPPGLKGTGNRAFAASHACVCNPLKKAHYPASWVPENCAFYHQHGDPEAAQTSGGKNTESFGMPNSGTVAVNPCREMLEMIRAKLRGEEVGRYVFPDQELLGDVWRERWVTLPYVYNALKPMRPAGVHGDIWRDERVKNVHYILNPKPWDERAEEAEGVNVWWHEANKERLEQERKEGVYDGIGDTGVVDGA